MEIKPNPALKLLAMLVVMALMFSCKDFIEPSISNTKVSLVAPEQNFQSTRYRLNFWWNEVEDANAYRLQIVTGTFNSPGSLMADSVITSNKFAFDLEPGDYQWRVRAENGSSTTDYSPPRNFKVVASTITTQSVTLLQPGNNTTTSESSVSFQWNSLYGATRYHIQVDSNSFADEAKLVFDKTTPSQQIFLALPKDQRYQWRVRAENDTAQARWSTINQITLDRTPPSKVILNLPANEQFVISPVNLQWQTAATATQYRLFIYKDDGVTPFNNTFPLLLSSNSYSFKAGLPGDKVFWKVAALDAAGNEGEASVTRSFTLQ